ncbi:MAG TPA: prepilin-type N-terminal cleavage/methylation domain-containing protein [bacterium]|nr:prepilin-type N-terminal cleavage/methylation domain-containing protein [bacterium]
MKILKKEKGFTLLEMLVVVTIIGILSFFTSPVFTRTLKSIRLQGTARKISSSVRLARRYAVMYKTDVYLEIDITNDKVTVKTDTQTISLYSMPSLVNITSVYFYTPATDATSGSVTGTFSPSGTFNRTVFYVHFAYHPTTVADESVANKNLFYTLTVDQSTGRPRVMQFGAGGPRF